MNVWLDNNFTLIDEILSQEGTKVIGLIRLTFAPFGITSYIIGVTNISLSNYMIGNLSYIINCCTHTFIGVSLYTKQSLDGIANNPDQIAKHNRMTKITLALEIAMTLAVSVLIGYVAKNILH